MIGLCFITDARYLKLKYFEWDSSLYPLFNYMLFDDIASKFSFNLTNWAIYVA